jgi:hypothetical protein
MPRFLALPLVIRADARGSHFQRVTLGVRQLDQRRAQVRRRRPRARPRWRAASDRSAPCTHQRRVAPLADRVQDRRGSAIDRGILRRLEGEERNEGLLEARARGSSGA